MIDYQRKFSEKRVRICAALQPIIVAMMVAGLSGAVMVMIGLVASHWSRKWHLGRIWAGSKGVASATSRLSPTVSIFADR